MKKISLLSFLLFVSIFPFSKSSAQTIELLAGNTLNGAVQGTLLGGATMAITDNSDFAPLRVGLGLGTLYGIGVGAYDITNGEGQAVLVSGLFNDGTNSSVIVLLDTFYGAALGSVVVTSIMLVANERLDKGLQYGAGIGAWVGFGFGLFDTFVLAKRSYEPVGATALNPANASGLLGLGFENGTSFGFVNPSVIGTLQQSKSDVSTTINPTVEIVNFRLNF